MTSLDPVVEKIFAEALHLGASDIHLEPTAEGLRLRWRVGGVLQPGPALPVGIHAQVVQKLKLMAKIESTQEGLPQDGSFVLDNVQVRLSAIPVLGGQSVVLRLFRSAEQLHKLAGLGFTPTQEALLAAMLRRGSGLILIAAPTGSGKTTTFYATLRAIDPTTQKIITVEDPVEQRLPGVCQVPVKGNIGFVDALRSILRQSPNVIGVGELRDAESAAAAAVRLVELGLEPAMLAEVLGGVVSQRLFSYRNASGVGVRRGVFELAVPSADFRRALVERAHTAILQQILQANGMQCLRDTVGELVRKGEIPAEAAWGELME